MTTLSHTKYQAIAADEASNFFSSNLQRLFLLKQRTPWFKNWQCFLFWVYWEHEFSLCLFYEPLSNTKEIAVLGKGWRCNSPILFNRIGWWKAIRPKEFSGIIIISKLNGDFVNIIRVINGVFLNLLKWQTVLKPQNGVCSLWLGMSESWQELKLLFLLHKPLFWFGPRGLTSTSFSSDNQIELAQVQVQVGDITSVLFVMTHCTGCDNDYVDEE
jgi:hypothetical protein